MHWLKITQSIVFGFIKQKGLIKHSLYLVYDPSGYYKINYELNHENWSLKDNTTDRNLIEGGQG